jgi:hypothetical protein
LVQIIALFVEKLKIILIQIKFNTLGLTLKLLKDKEKEVNKLPKTNGRLFQWSISTKNLLVEILIFSLN